MSFYTYAFKTHRRLKIPNSLFFKLSRKLSTMADTQNTNTEEVVSQPIMKIQSTSYQVEGDVSLYPNELRMLIVALQHSGLEKAMFDAFAVLMTWLSMAGSTSSYIKAMDVITFYLVNDKKIRLTKKMFIKILAIPNSPPFFQLMNSQVMFMLNETGHQPPLDKISKFKNSSLPSLWNFLFGIYLRCLTG